MNKSNPNALQANININPNDIEAMKCECGSNIFIQFNQLKHISAFYTGTGQSMGLAVPRYVCTNPGCGLMYENAMDKADVKKYARNPNAARFNWADFFKVGLQIVSMGLAEQAGKDHAEMTQAYINAGKYEKENS